MTKFIQLIFLATLSLGWLSSASAFELGTNITIYDKNSSAETGWYGTQEDDEVEPGMESRQAWDLEGAFYNQSNILSLAGGFDFAAGVDGYSDYVSGDIFIATGGAPDYGDIHSTLSDGFHDVANSYGYDYVLDLDFSDTGYTYTVFAIGEDSRVMTAYFNENDGSSPWKYVGGGTETGITGTFTLLDSDLPADVTEFSGDSHYLLTGFDLSFLGHGTDFYAHFTMGCGNDNLMGSGTVVPEPSTFLLFAAGGGLALLARRKKR